MHSYLHFIICDKTHIVNRKSNDLKGNIMSQFIYFTPEEKARAQNTDLVSLLRAQGERPVRSGREFRTPNDPSITVRGNKWFDHSARVGGYAVSFVQR